tara:strand:- start:122 stop:610 length:489 start_codon:yes stop_codon:yes gene_type:complete
MIAITRFDNKTYAENRDWCKRSGFTGTIYGTPIRISESIEPDTILFVLEMNNSTNKIMGIGMIRAGGSGQSTVGGGKRCRIYTDNNYNRFIYRSDHRIDMYSDYLPLEFHKKIKIIETLLFSGSRHCKRGQGISLIPLWIKNIKSLTILDDLRAIFRDKKQV